MHPELSQSKCCQQVQEGDPAPLALERPQLEYCIQVGAPWSKKDIDILKRAQQRPPSQLGGLTKMTCEERLRDVSLLLLDKTCLRGELLAFYNYLLRGDREDGPDLWKCPGDRTWGVLIKQ